MAGTNSEARKSIESQPLGMLREADRLGLNERVWRALTRVYGDATYDEGVALRLALEDQDVIA